MNRLGRAQTLRTIRLSQNVYLAINLLIDNRGGTQEHGVKISLASLTNFIEEKNGRDSKNIKEETTENSAIPQSEVES